MHFQCCIALTGCMWPPHRDHKMPSAYGSRRCHRRLHSAPGVATPRLGTCGRSAENEGCLRHMTHCTTIASCTCIPSCATLWLGAWSCHSEVKRWLRQKSCGTAITTCTRVAGVATLRSTAIAVKPHRFPRSANPQRTMHSGTRIGNARHSTAANDVSMRPGHIRRRPFGGMA